MIRFPHTAYPRFNATPYAGNLHVRICAGGGDELTVVPTATIDGVSSR